MISDNSIKKLLKKTGALRISKEAVKKIRKIAENYIVEIARKAIKNAEYSGRKTIKEEDIEASQKTETEY